MKTEIQGDFKGYLTRFKLPSPKYRTINSLLYEMART